VFDRFNLYAVCNLLTYTCLAVTCAYTVIFDPQMLLTCVDHCRQACGYNTRINRFIVVGVSLNFLLVRPKVKVKATYDRHS